jgi:hypothetical protein
LQIGMAAAQGNRNPAERAPEASWRGVVTVFDLWAASAMV